VFRLQEPPAAVEFSRDYASCRGYGEMRTILACNENPSNDAHACYEKLRAALSDFKPGDFILWSGGDPMSAFLAGVVLGDLGAEDVNWLRWDRRTDGTGARTRHGYYTPVRLA
jgi:hypothetical protein